MPYLTAPQIEAEMTALAASAPNFCKKIAFPNPTVSEGIGPTTYSYLRIGRAPSPFRRTVLVIAGMHAREWGQSDAVISFARKLIAAALGSTAFIIPSYTDAAGNTFAQVTVDADTIFKMDIGLEILLVPLANPDGRAFSQSDPANRFWRKNRRPRAAAADPDATVGVDLNRNFDIAWDYKHFYTTTFADTALPTMLPAPILSASDDPADDRFGGIPLPGAARPRHPDSEPEARNLIWLLDNHPVTYSVDLHCHALKVMYPWGIERNGINAAQNFRDRSLDRTRDGTLGNAYSEFFPAQLLTRHNVVAGSMSDGIFAATGRRYKIGGIAETIYPATGSFTDFHFSRQFTIAGSPAIHAFAVEFGDAADDFQPLYDSPYGFPRIEREVHALLLRLLQAALPPSCPLSAAVAGLVSGPAWLDTLHQARDALLSSSQTRAAMLWLNRVYRRVGAALVPYLARRRWARLALAYGVVAPAAQLTALVLKWSAR